MFDAGRARHKITIQRRNITRDSIGANVETWVFFANCRAVITQQQGSEFWAGGADQFVNQYRTKFEIRHRTDITTEMRVIWLGKTYRIESVIDPGERRQQLTIDTVQTEEAIG